MTITIDRAARKRWRLWILLLAVAVVPFLTFSPPPYLALDSLLVTHVLFASVAMVICCFQVWPWFRRRHPIAASGRSTSSVACSGRAWPDSRSAGSAR